MIERRNTPRIAVDRPCTLSVNGRKVATQLVDLSEEGALFRLGADGEESVSPDDLGSDATFLVSSPPPALLYTGEMIRLFNKGSARFVALRFWTRPKPAPSA